MNKWLKVLFLVWIIAGTAYADNEFWSSDTFQFTYNDKVKLQVIPEIRIKNNLSDLYYLRVYLGPSIALNKNFGINLYYAPNFVKASNIWTGLGYFDLTYKAGLPWYSLEFSNRERLEYDFTPDVLKARSLFQLSLAGWIINDELFFNTAKGFFDEGRSQIGYGLKLNKDASLSMNYLVRSQKSKATDDWTITSGVNAGLKINY